ncbi:hypothetical protein CSA56_02685 [candidate division KSB3 bacterium]|uniref:Tetratricopeptide repeat protein n=1 Tax=candidate division KSB3 bacterium TaxID=2044937 RepID=A0A2G6KJF0_9BACT|nr:MAG: hypothetical protein CSA56_02685 [candidate division KSB3 bacterium]
MKSQQCTLGLLLCVTCLILLISCAQPSGNTQPGPPKQTPPNPQNVDKIVQSGLAQLEAGDVAKAIAFCEKAAKLAPNNLKAAKCLQDARLQRDEMVEKALRKGIAYFEEDELEAAMKQWEYVLDLDPSHKKAQDYKEQTQIRLDALQ